MIARRAVLFSGLIACAGLAPGPVAADHNATRSNRDGSLTGINMGDEVALWFDRAPGAASYRLFVAPASRGPWSLIGTERPQAGKPILTTVDRGEGRRPASTTLFRERTLWYRMQALGRRGGVVRVYPALKIPPYRV